MSRRMINPGSLIFPVLLENIERLEDAPIDIAIHLQKEDNFPMDVANTNSGRLRIGLILFLALVGTCVYLGFQLAPYWINAYELKDFMAVKARTGELASDENIRTAISEKANELGITLMDRNIVILRSPKEMSISTYWTMDYRFFGLYTRTFTFSPHVAVNY